MYTLSGKLFSNPHFETSFKILNNKNKEKYSISLLQHTFFNSWTNHFMECVQQVDFYEEDSTPPLPWCPFTCLAKMGQNDDPKGAGFFGGCGKAPEIFPMFWLRGNFWGGQNDDPGGGGSGYPDRDPEVSP